MSTVRSNIFAAVASAAVLVVGWELGTASASSTVGTTTGTASAGTATAASGGAASASAAGTTATGKTGSYTGETVSYRYGRITVTAVLSNGKLTDVTANVVSDGQGRSNSINSQALPIIKSRVLAANSSDVQTVSGATYTTTAYLTSLQSALDKAK